MHKLLLAFSVISFLATAGNSVYCQSTVSGQVNDNVGTGVSNARITLFNSTLSFFRETRTTAVGAFTLTSVPAGTYSLGIEKIGKEYVQQTLSVPASAITVTLYNETQQGQWNIIVNSPEPLGGTNLGALMPDSKLYFCHETVDPFYFNPVTNTTMPAPGSGNVQGCVGPIQNSDGKLWFIGGALVPSYGPGSKKVKYFDPVANTWTFKPDMLDSRWYPSVLKLANNKILIAGGGGINNPIRTKTSELYNPATGTSVFTDTLAIGNEVSPILQLYSGKVLMTHRPPQLFNPANNQWDLAGNFVQSNRTPDGDHADHELVLMPNGDVIAVGYATYTPGAYGSFIEKYNPTTNTWSLGTSLLPIRSRAKTVLMPDKKILVIGGEKENPSDTTSVNQWGYMNLCDMYNPATDSWRRLKRLNYKREYHCNAILVPDGRVIAVGGEGSPGNDPPFSVIEAFTPPYLSRGVRPAITSISTTEYTRGAQINFTSAYGTLTAVQLISNAVVTHFMNSGNNRFLELTFTQTGNNVTATIPTDSVKVPDGYYMLFAMIDDIPSVAKIIRIAGGVAAPCTPPTASITASGATTFCAGGSVTLSVAAQAGSTYQWKKNAVNIVGATSTSYAANATGSYTVTVTKTCGNTTSNGVSVTVNPAPTASITSSTTTLCPGASILLSATTGTGYTYQWLKNGINIAGATASTYSASTTGGYKAIVTNSCGTASSNTITITANAPPAATINSSTTTLCAGASILLTANTGSGLSYQWKLNGANITGATVSTYNAGTAGGYTVTVTNNCGSSTTSNTITITAGPAVPATPGTISGTAKGLCGGVTKTYTIAAVSSATSYTWTVPSGVTINAGQGTTSLTVHYPTYFTTGTITVKASNACGSSGLRTKAVSGAPATPGTITGSSTFCASQTLAYSIIPVTSATSYTWTGPAGATVVSGQGTTSVSIQFATASGNVGVKANNTCGHSANRLKAVSVVGCREGEGENFKILLYPNPTSTHVSLNLDPTDEFEIEIYNALGQSVTRVQNQNEIDVSSMPDGIYLLTARGNGIYLSQTFIKQ